MAGKVGLDLQGQLDVKDKKERLDGFLFAMVCLAGGLLAGFLIGFNVGEIQGIRENSLTVIRPFGMSENETSPFQNWGINETIPFYKVKP